MNSVLIIEDDPMGGTLVRRMCEQAKVRPREFKVVTTHEEGLRIANEEPAPDLIIADLTTSSTSEQDCIKTYIPAYARRAAVLVWTGSPNPDVVLQCHAAGAMSCLIKQNLSNERCGIERLGQAISDAILNWRREHAIRR